PSDLRRPELDRAADQANRDTEKRQFEADRLPDEAGRCSGVKRRSEQAEHAGGGPESREQQAGRALAATRLPVAQLDAGPKEGWSEPERRPTETEQELDSGLVKEALRFPSHDQDAEL